MKTMSKRIALAALSTVLAVGVGSGVCFAEKNTQTKTIAESAENSYISPYLCYTFDGNDQTTGTQKTVVNRGTAGADKVVTLGENTKLVESAADTTAGNVASGGSGKAYVRLPDDTFAHTAENGAFTLAFDFYHTQASDVQSALLFQFFSEEYELGTVPTHQTKDAAGDYAYMTGMNNPHTLSYLSFTNGESNTAANTQTGEYEKDSNPAFKTKTWYTAVLAYNGSEISLGIYHDGALLKSASSSVSKENLKMERYTQLLLGYDIYNRGIWKLGLNGKIDNVFYFDNEIPREQHDEIVSGLYEYGVDYAENPYLYYTFDGNDQTTGTQKTVVNRGTAGADKVATLGEKTKLVESAADTTAGGALNSSSKGSGKAYVRLPDDTFAHTAENGAFTLAFDFYHTAVGGDNNSALLFQFFSEEYELGMEPKHPTNKAGDYAYMTGMNNPNYMSFLSFTNGEDNTAANTQTGEHENDSNPAFKTETWYTAVLAYNGSEISLGIYSDGALLKSVSSSVSKENLKMERYTQLLLGYDKFSSGVWKWGFNGKIDNVFYFDDSISKKALNRLVNGNYSYMYVPAPEAEVGASVRMSTEMEDSGIRFMGYIQKADYDLLKETAEKVEAGVLIVPTDYLADGTEFTEQALLAANKLYLKIDCTETLKDAKDKDGFYCFSGAMVNIKAHNYTRAFSGISYLAVTVNGETTVRYSEYSEADNSRSVYNVAKAAYNDRDEEGKSKYTQAQLDVLYRYIDGVVEISMDDQGVISYADKGAYYSPSYTVVYENGKLCVTSETEIKTLLVNGKKLSFTAEEKTDGEKIVYAAVVGYAE